LYLFVPKPIPQLPLPQHQQQSPDHCQSLFQACAQVWQQQDIQQLLLIFTHTSLPAMQFVPQAFAQLRYSTFAIMPNYTGSYNMLAMRQLRYQIFDKIIWNGSRVLADTLASINKLVKTYHLLPPTP
jgi:glycosyltransferase A (GT-A) superfamily protein (DUF2064 family)